MKKYNLLIGGAIMAAITAGCAHEFEPFEKGAGTLRLSANVNSDVQIVSRALTADQEKALAESAIIWISNEKGLVHEFIGASNVPESLRLLSGAYTAEAWVGDSVPASWDKTFYKSGFQKFNIATGKDTEVTLNCRVANTLASVKYATEVLDVLSNPVMTIGLADGLTDGSHTLTFDETNTGAKGRFMINSRTKGLVYTITGTQSDGTEFTKSDTIKNIKPSTEYRLNVTYAGQDLVVGGAYFQIEVEEEPVGDESQVQIILPPNIFALESGFDSNNSCRGEEGKIGRKSIFIVAGCQITDLELTSADFTPIVGGDGRIDLLSITGAPKEALHAAGVNWEYAHDEENDNYWTRLNLEEEFTDALAEGDHTFAIMVQDELDKVTNATFTIKVTNAPAAVSPVQESSISYTGVTLEATKLKEATEYGFELREVSASRSYEDWTRIPATVQGNRIYAVVSDLNIGREYEYRVYADDFVSEETITFATKSPQLPNSGFELWCTDSDNAALPNASTNELFWDNGNHGSQTMGKNVTDKDSGTKHSGSYSAMLKSQFVGVGTIGKFAAGNLFIGKYLKTDGTDGELGWGRSWEYRPVAVKLWVKYEPKVGVSKKGANDSYIGVGQMDQGIIYVALTNDDKKEYTDGTSWPFIIKTKSQELFDKNAANVIAYGEHVFTEATNGMIQITIPLEEVHAGDVANIVFVASASRYGDYFSGGDGSTMWIDDIELVY